MAVCNITALYQYGARDSLLRKAWREGRKSIPIGDEEMDEPNSEQPTPPLLPPLYGSGGGGGSPLTQSIQEISFGVSKRLAFTILSLTLDRIDDNNVRPHWHAWMVFLSHIIGSVPAAQLIEIDFPWVALVEVLNKLLAPQGGDDQDISAKMLNANFPSPVGHPLPEDYNLRGFDWARSYFPQNWFNDARIDSEERTQEFPSMTNIRRERILWLAARICAQGDWLSYCAESRSFAIHPALRERLEASKAAAAAATYHRDQSHIKVLSEELDVDMGTTGCGHSDDDFCIVDMPEDVRRLKERKRQLEAQLQAPLVVTAETIAEVTRSAVLKGPEALHPDFTAYVVDTNLLVAHLETFSLITGQCWSVVVPNSGKQPLRWRDRTVV